MRNFNLLTIVAAVLAALVAGPLVAAPFTATMLASLDRITDPRVLPDGGQVVYDVRSTDWEANKGVHAVWIVDAVGRTPARRLIAPAAGATQAR